MQWQILRLLLQARSSRPQQKSYAPHSQEMATLRRYRDYSRLNSRKPRKVIDPIALANLIISIPAALLAVADLVDRMRKRKRAQAVIDAAKQVRDENGVSVSIISLEGAVRRVDGLTADELLEEAAKLNSAK